MAGFIPYVINSVRGGFSDENDKGIRGAFKHGYGLDIRGRDDVITAKQAAVTVFGEATGVLSGSHTGTTQTGIMQFFVPSSKDGSTYCFGSTGSIFARSDDGQWTFVYNDENGAIKGAAEWGVTDAGSTATYLFWATNTSIARKILNGADSAPDSGTARWTDVNNNWRATLDPADWHTMDMAAGELMVANGNYLASISYNEDGIFDVAALNIRPGNVIKCLEERDDNIILGSTRLDSVEEGHIWSWVVTALNWIQKKRIPARGVNALISAELLLLQAGDDGEIFFSDFVNATPLIAVPGGGQVNPGGVTIEDNLALFGFFGGSYPGIWSYGRQHKNQPHALNWDYRLARTVGGSTISTIGAIAMVNDILFASWGTTDESTSEYGVDQISSTTKATAVFEGLEFDNGQPYAKHWYQDVKVTAKPMASGTSLSVKFKHDYETDWRYAVRGDGSTTHAISEGHSSMEAHFLINKPGLVYEVGAELNPSGNNSPQVTGITNYVSKEEYHHG